MKEELVSEDSKISLDVNCNLISGECMSLGNGSRLYLDGVELTKYYHSRKSFSQIYMSRDKKNFDIFSLHVATPSIDMKHFLRVDIQIWFAEDPLDFGPYGQEKFPTNDKVVNRSVAVLMHVTHEVNIGTNTRFVGISNVNSERLYCLPNADMRTDKGREIEKSECTIIPHLLCVDRCNNKTSLAHFSYMFSCPDPRFLPHEIHIPIGPNNRFDPSPEDRGQPTTFSGTNQGTVFTVEWDGQDLTWILNNKYTLPIHYSKPCDIPLKLGYRPQKTMNKRELFDWYENYLVDRIMSLNALQHHFYTAYIQTEEFANLDLDVTHVPCGYMDVKIEAFYPFCAKIERIQTDFVSLSPINRCAKTKNETTGLYQKLFLYDQTRLRTILPWNVTIQRLKPSPTPVFVTLKCASLSSLSHVNYSLILFVTIVLIFCIKCFFE